MVASLGYNFPRGLAKDFSNPRVESITRKKFGDEKFKEAIAKALQDEDIVAIPGLTEILENPDEGTNPFMVDIIA